MALWSSPEKGLNSFRMRTSALARSSAIQARYMGNTVSVIWEIRFLAVWLFSRNTSRLMRLIRSKWIPPEMDTEKSRSRRMVLCRAYSPITRTTRSCGLSTSCGVFRAPSFARWGRLARRADLREAMLACSVAKSMVSGPSRFSSTFREGSM